MKIVCYAGKYIDFSWSNFILMGREGSALVFISNLFLSQNGKKFGTE